MQKDLLEANGIPAVVKGDDTARMITPFIMTEPSLWVYADEQVDEAEKLILDPDYEVANKLDVDDFYKATKEIRENPSNLNDALLNLGVGFGAILFVCFLLIMWLSA